MKTFVLAAAIAGLPFVAAADPVHGVWKSQPGDTGNFGHVTIADCGGAICGTLVRAFDGSGKEISSENIGKRIVWDMVPSGDGNYSGGRIWDPEKDKTYKSKMALSGNALKVSGCIGPICRGQNWTRVK